MTFNISKFYAQLPNVSPFLSKCTAFASIDSTMKLIEKHIDDGLIKHGSLVVSDSQNHGTGRNSRLWASPTGNLYFTFAYLLNQPVDALKLNRASAVAIADTLYSLGLDPKIKWPNDIWVNHKKIAGILIDCIKSPCHTQTFASVGIGLNIVPFNTVVDSDNFSSVSKFSVEIQKIQKIATDITSELSIIDSVSSNTLSAMSSQSKNNERIDISRETLLASILTNVIDNMSISDSLLSQQWTKYDLLLDKKVTIFPSSYEDSSNSYNAQVVGYTPQGLIKIKDEMGEIKMLPAAEIKLFPSTPSSDTDTNDASPFKKT